MGYDTFHDLMLGYLDTLKGRPSHTNMRHVANRWILTLDHTPTRKEILERHRTLGHGHCQAGATTANTELKLMKAAFRWGIYQEVWPGIDPTMGVTPWETPARKDIFKHQQFVTLLTYFREATTEKALRDRVLFGLCLFTGSRPSEGRVAPLTDIVPYGSMGCWRKAKTKNGQAHEIPLPSQLMTWIEDWKKVRPCFRENPYLFPGQGFNRPLSANMMLRRWEDLRLQLGLHGLSGAHPLPPAAALPSDEPRLRTLSKREREVLAGFASGDSSCRRIAAQLGISRRTVEIYLTRLLDKLQLKTSIELTHFARAHEGEATVSVPDQAPPRPVLAPVVMERPVMPGSVPLGLTARRSEEYQEWPG